MVNPPRIGSGLLVWNCASAPSTLEVASRWVEPYTPVNACALSEPAEEAGNRTVAAAWGEPYPAGNRRPSKQPGEEGGNSPGPGGLIIGPGQMLALTFQ